ncbi:hypothetical protein ACFL5P_03795, partial [candidate division KSB1 bacterium]
KENILGYNLSIGFKQNISGSFFLKFRTTFISTKKLRSDISPMWFSRSEEYKIMKLNTFDASIGLGWYLGKALQQDNSRRKEHCRSGTGRPPDQARL